MAEGDDVHPVCVRCKRPIPKGSGRYRRTVGDFHVECWEQDELPVGETEDDSSK
jgi:hypothetical protein